MATRDCYLATSVNQPGDAVVHQVRSRGRKAPGKRQVESSAARKTHGASTGLTGLISGFGTKRPWRFRPMSALRLGCVKTCASRERAELFSPFSSFDCDCQCCSFPIQRNRDKISTCKFDVGVFTQAGSKTEVTLLPRQVRSTLRSIRRQTTRACPKSATSGRRRRGWSCKSPASRCPTPSCRSLPDRRSDREQLFG